MKAQLIDGKRISAEIKAEAAEEAAALKAKGITPCLAVVLVGDDSASQVYVNNKKKACEAVGIRSVSHVLSGGTTEEALLELIAKLNADKDIHGILVQMPVPKQIDERKVILAIDPKKDVDCFHPVNVGNLHTGGEGFLPCTPAGIIELIKRSGHSIEGKQCVVIGRSNIVGKPVAMLLMQENGTVTICHSRTRNLAEICRGADIIVSAVGKVNTVTADMVKEGAILIDVGMNRNEAGKLCGDVDFENVKEIAGAITPVSRRRWPDDHRHADEKLQHSRKNPEWIAIKKNRKKILRLIPLTFRESQGYSIYIEEADYERKGSVCMKKGVLKGIVCLVVIVVIWMAVSFRSKPLSEEGEISLENFVVCRVQVMEIKNDTGYGRAAEIREKERMQKALDALGEIEVRKMMPWEKLPSDRQGQETYYTMMIRYDSETEGRYESLACWEGGRIDFRDTAYMTTGKEKTKATDLLEALLQEYETAE